MANAHVLQRPLGTAPRTAPRTASRRPLAAPRPTQGIMRLLDPPLPPLHLKDSVVRELLITAVGFFPRPPFTWPRSAACSPASVRVATPCYARLRVRAAWISMGWRPARSISTMQSSPAGSRRGVSREDILGAYRMAYSPRQGQHRHGARAGGTVGHAGCTLA